METPWALIRSTNSDAVNVWPLPQPATSMPATAMAARAASCRFPRPRATRQQADTLIDMSAALPLAHVGHWYLWIPYAIPVVIVLAASLHAFRQQRRENRERQQGE